MEKIFRGINFFAVLPYFCFIGGAMFWLYLDISNGRQFNYIAFGFIAILIMQLVIKNKAMGVSLGLLTIVISVWLFLAVLSEFREFKVVSESAKQLITIGSILSLGGLSMGVILLATDLKAATIKSR